MEINTEKLSIVIDQALEDMEKTEQHQYMTVDMSNWVILDTQIVDRSDVKQLGEKNQTVSTTCNVCFAGGLMFHRLGIDDSPKFDDFPADQQKAFKALDRLRRYNFNRASLEFYEDENKLNFLYREGIYKFEYDEDPERFKENMRRIARLLEEKGL